MLTIIKFKPSDMKMIRSIRYIAISLILVMFFTAQSVSAMSRPISNEASSGSTASTDSVGSTKSSTRKSSTSALVETKGEVKGDSVVAKPVVSNIVNASGIIKEIIMEPADGKIQTNPNPIFVLESFDGNRYQLAFDKNFSKYTNQEVKLTGTKQANGEVVVSKIKSSGVVPGPVTPKGKFPKGQTEYDTESKQFQKDFSQFLIMPQATVGTRSVYIVNVNFQNDTSQPVTPAQVDTAAFSGDYSANNFFKEASYYKFGLAGTVHPVWITIPFTNANCETNMMNAWTQAVETLMAGNSAWENAKTKVINWAPISSCTLPEAGATLGIKGDMDQPGKVWIQLTPFRVADNLKEYIKSLSHEMGHNLGNLHAGGITVTGATSDSADRADVMGSRFRYPNIYNRLGFGWTVGKVTTLAGPGTYTVDLLPADQIFNKGNKAVIIQLKDASGTPSTDYMSIETRRRYLYDDFTPEYASYTSGVSIRYGAVDMTPSSSRPFLLDTTFNSPTGFDDAPLAIGQSYTDTQYGVTIQVVQRSAALGNRLIVTLTR